MPKEISLFQSACGKLRISRLGPLTMLVIDGQGLGICLTADFSPIEKWAKSRPQGPNATIDAGKLMEKIDVIVTRAGTTFASTRGSIKPLESIVKGIKAAGMDTKEFQLPPELKDGYVSPEEKEKERKEKEAKEAARKGQNITAA